MSELIEFNKMIESSFRRKDGARLKELLRLRSFSVTGPMEEYVTKGGPLPTVEDETWSDLPQIVEKRFAAGAALNWSDWVATYDHLAECLSKYIAALAKDTGWSIPLLHALCEDLRVCAEQADEQLRSEGQKPGKLEEAERILKRGFVVTNNDRGPLDEESKKMGTLGVINQLLKIYFKLNNLRLCGNLTRTVNAPNFPSFELFPPQDRVTYKYYAGRLHLYDDRIEEAATDLLYAFKHLPVSAETQKRRVLLYLIPAKILTGSTPSRKMLIKFNMHWFLQIVKAIKTGNLFVFDQAMEEHEEFFIRKALYLAIEKMRPLVYRSLCRIIFEIGKDYGPAGSGHKVALDKFQKALALCGTEMQRDEIECILANLIFNNYIKGYISHKVGYLVLSKKDPFPTLQV